MNINAYYPSSFANVHTDSFRHSNSHSYESSNHYTSGSIINNNNSNNNSNINEADVALNFNAGSYGSHALEDIKNFQLQHGLLSEADSNRHTDTGGLPNLTYPHHHHRQHHSSSCSPLSGVELLAQPQRNRNQESNGRQHRFK